MKKIMFNDQYGLTQAVLDGRKTQTRRIVELSKKFKEQNDIILKYFKGPCGNFHWGYMSRDSDGHELGQIRPPYNVGEAVAIAQSYRDVCLNDPMFFEGLRKEAGWNNKMFVKAEYMPWQIVIENIWLERLQGISEADAMREGVFKYHKPPLHHEADLFAPWPPHVRPYKWNINNLIYRCTARYAFAYLIDRVCGRGTWNSNPWVVAYEFRLQRTKVFSSK